MDEKNQQKEEAVKKVDIDGSLPHQIHSPSFKNSTKKMEKPFVNEFGVVIGDSFYNSAKSPLNKWSTKTDPSVMAGDRWIHPTNDIGWNSAENLELLEDKPPQGVPFMHPSKDVSYGRD